MRRTTILTVVLAAVLTASVGLSACGGGVKVNFDKNGKEKACSALSSVSDEVAAFTGGSTTVGDAQAKLTDIRTKLTSATDTKTGFTKSVLAPLTKALDAAEQKLSGVDASKSISDVPGVDAVEKGVDSAYSSLNKLFKCA